MLVMDKYGDYVDATSIRCEQCTLYPRMCDGGDCRYDYLVELEQEEQRKAELRKRPRVFKNAKPVQLEGGIA